LSQIGPATFRQKLGCWLHERWRAELVLRASRLARWLGWSWLDLCNRDERLTVDPDSGGRACAWADSSRLTLARVFPTLAPRLLDHAFRTWPMKFGRDAPGMPGRTPAITFLIPIGGGDRMVQFGLALDTALAQTGIDVEIIVIEQSPQPTLGERLPAGVRHLHQPADAAGGFNKSRALNMGAREARSEYLIILDADYLVPQRFASECARVLGLVEAARPARWIGYLDRESTESLARSREIVTLSGIENIVSNNPMPLAVRRSTYLDIGGHDEAYVGWGGEDTEFLDRLRTRKISEGGWMPILHAWHAPAAKKVDGDRNRDLHERIMAVPVLVRIQRLASSASPTEASEPYQALGGSGC